MKLELERGLKKTDSKKQPTYTCTLLHDYEH